MILHPDVTDPRSKLRFETLEVDLYEIFGDNLDFTDSVYCRVNMKLCYFCNKHEKYYEASPNTLLNGSGCPDCGRLRTTYYHKIKAAKAKKEFVAKAEMKHPDKYTYEEATYVASRGKVKIWCKHHQDYFMIRANDLLNGQGCPDCGRESMALKLSAEARLNFPAKAELKNPNKNYYHLVDYKNAHIKVEIWCIGCGVSYWITPDNVLRGIGHDACANYGFKSGEPAILYYLRIETRNQICYKIGITNRSVAERFKTDMKKITIIKEWHYDLGQDAYDEEQRILKEYKEFQYKGDSILESGNTELFRCDVLDLDY